MTNANLARTLTDMDVVSDVVTQNSYPRFALANNSPAKVWEKEVIAGLSRLSRLQAGWDGYNARPMDGDAAIFALRLLYDVMGPRTPVPQLVPSAVGGLQLEWHEKDVDLEIHVTAPYQCELWFQDRREEAQELALDITDDFSPLRAPLSLLNNR